MHIIGLEVENFGKIKAISMQTEGKSAVVVSGRNAQGKTSLLNAIWATLGGRVGNNAAKPVREGADEARVVVDLGDMTVTRIWRNDTTHVEVRSKEGAVYKSPQALLDGFIGKSSFDPLAFTRLKSRDQKDALLELVTLDVDLDALEADRVSKYEKRTEVGRAKAALGEVPEVDPELPTDEERASAVIAELEENRAWNRSIDAAAELAASTRSNIAQMEEQLAGYREVLGRAESEASLARRGEEQLKAKLERIEDTNARIRANNAARERAGAIAGLAGEYAALTGQIDAIDGEKAAALARADFPVQGLGFDADGVTFNGVPFSQSSSAEQIRVSMAMAIAANPTLRVVRIMDGSLLDDESTRIITDLAADNDFQVWMEVVDRGDGVGFVIEDGELVGAP